MEEQPSDPDDALERRYTNFLRVGFNESEFLLDFAQLYAGGAPAPHTFLVASPFHARKFAELLDSCVEDYDSLYGPPPGAPA